MSRAMAIIRKIRRENNRKCADTNLLIIDQTFVWKKRQFSKVYTGLMVSSIRTKFPKSDILL